MKPKYIDLMFTDSDRGRYRSIHAWRWLGKTWLSEAWPNDTIGFLFKHKRLSTFQTFIPKYEPRHG